MDPPKESIRVSSSDATIPELRQNFAEITTAFKEAITKRFTKNAEYAFKFTGINQAFQDEAIRLGQQEHPRAVFDIPQDSNLNNPDVDLFRSTLRFRTRFIWSNNGETHEIQVIYSYNSDEENLTIISGDKEETPGIPMEISGIRDSSLEESSGERRTQHSTMYAHIITREVWSNYPEVVMDRLTHAFASPINSFGVPTESPLAV